MPVTLQEAIADLYRIAVTEKAATSTQRLMALGKFCTEQLGRLGLAGAETEREVPGIGREKQWDVAWYHGGKCRLAISLKSILRNVSGTVPNRIDDLIGEVANAQLASPEMVIGYLLVFDVSQDVPSKRNGGKTWSDILVERLQRLSGRRAPVWSFGMIEAYAVIRVDFSEGPKLLTPDAEVESFFQSLVEEVRKRNPSVP